jgi:hypothetical protein
MKSIELRIGNLVNYQEDGTLFNVIGIDNLGISVKNDNEETWIELDQFEPIPLTEEWLLKFGFNNLSGCYYERNGIGFITGYANDGSFVCGNSFGPRHCHFYYVHQLQNIYFALTNEELTLTP